jgi:hypothetical protein
MAVSLTAGVFVSERKQGLLDRCLVAGKSEIYFILLIEHVLLFLFFLNAIVHFPIIGVTMIEILIGQLVNQFSILIGQTTLVFLCMLLAFNIPCHGNLALAVFITFLQGFVGMCFGREITIFL